MPSAQRDDLASRWAMAIDRSLDWHTSEPAPPRSAGARRRETVRAGPAGKVIGRSTRPNVVAAARIIAVAVVAVAAFLAGRRSR